VVLGERHAVQCTLVRRGPDDVGGSAFRVALVAADARTGAEIRRIPQQWIRAGSAAVGRAAVAGTTVGVDPQSSLAGHDFDGPAPGRVLPRLPA
jgi:hypothetical protein